MIFDQNINENKNKTQTIHKLFSLLYHLRIPFINYINLISIHNKTLNVHNILLHNHTVSTNKQYSQIMSF